MNARERILTVLNSEPDDLFSVVLWYTEEVGDKLKEHCHVKDDLELYEVMGIDKIV